VFSVAHGSVDTVNFICDEPRIKAISFVGSDKAGKYIYDRGGANGKRVQANLGAKSLLSLPVLSPLLSTLGIDTDRGRDRPLHHHARCQQELCPQLDYRRCFWRCVLLEANILRTYPRGKARPDEKFAKQLAAGQRCMALSCCQSDSVQHCTTYDGGGRLQSVKLTQWCSRQWLPLAKANTGSTK
jgi:Aldehyde dehydrogenase family